MSGYRSVGNHWEQEMSKRQQAAGQKEASGDAGQTKDGLPDWFPGQLALSTGEPVAPDTSIVPDEHVSFALLGSIGTVGGLFRRFLDRQTEADLGMSGPRVMLLAALSVPGSFTMGELAQLLDVTPRAITRLVDGLEQEGHVTRIPDAHDRRLVHVRVKAATRERVLIAIRKHRKLINELTDGLTTEALREALQTVFLLGQALRTELNDEGSRRPGRSK